MKINIVTVCASIIVVLALIMSIGSGVETSWRHSGFELWGYDINFTDHNASNIYLLDADYLHGDCSNVSNLNASNISSGEIPLTQIPATLTGKDADTVDGYHAADLGGNTGGFAAEGIEVFNGSMLSADTFQDLDLSSIVGSRYAIVVLSVISSSANDCLQVRQKGSTRTASSGMEHTGSEGGRGSVVGNYLNVVGITNSSGVIQIAGDDGVSTYTINVIGWVGLS